MGGGQVPGALVGGPDSGACSTGGATRLRGWGRHGDPSPQQNPSLALPDPLSSTRSSSCVFRPA